MEPSKIEKPEVEAIVTVRVRASRNGEDVRVLADRVRDLVDLALDGGSIAEGTALEVLSFDISSRSSIP